MPPSACCAYGAPRASSVRARLGPSWTRPSSATTATSSIATCSVACNEFSQGEIDAEVADKLALRLKFDAENGKGSYLKARSSEICEMLVKRFGLELSKKKKRASVKKSDDAEDEE